MPPCAVRSRRARAGSQAATLRSSRSVVAPACLLNAWKGKQVGTNRYERAGRGCAYQIEPMWRFWESKPEHDTQHRADDQANQAGGRKYLQTARWGVRACALMGPIRRNGRLGLAAAA